MPELTVLERLAAEFPKNEVRQRDGGRGVKLDYIDVVQTINRLCEVLKADWDWRVLDSNVALVEGSNGPTFLAQERGELQVWLPDRDRPIVRGGSGADTDPRDPDKAIKTADAEALKKAGHKFQIALYLWDEGKRNEIADFRKLQGASLGQLKQAALIKSNQKTPDGLLEAILAVNPNAGGKEALQSREVLLEYLAA
jgi:hypothetical protein